VQIIAAPKGLQSQAKGQKSNEFLIVILTPNEIGEIQSLFYWFLDRQRW
jgi:hypothetical protein